MQTLMLAATGLGLSSCPMIGFEIESSAELIHLPRGSRVGADGGHRKGTQDPLAEAGPVGPRDPGGWTTDSDPGKELKRIENEFHFEGSENQHPKELEVKQ